MKYTVTWTRRAIRRLADLWSSASDRQAVTDAANSIDRVLRNTRLTSVNHTLADGPVEVLSTPPLAVYYVVNDGDRMVTVWAVWPIR